MTSLPDCLQAYLDYGRSQRFSPLTLRSKAYHIRTFLNWLESTAGVSTADGLQLQHLEAWQAHVATATTDRGLPLRPRIINKYIESVRGFAKHLVSRGILPNCKRRGKTGTEKGAE